MNDCSALISSGIVTLSGNVGGSGTITATSKNNFIIEKIRTSNHPNGYGLQTNYATNFTINENKAYDGGYGIMINHSSYVQLRNIEIYNITNSNDGLEISNSSHISADTIITHDNDRVGIHMSSVSGSTLSGIISYNNGIHGVMMSISDYNILTNISSYNNA